MQNRHQRRVRSFVHSSKPIICTHLFCARTSHIPIQVVCGCAQTASQSAHAGWVEYDMYLVLLGGCHVERDYCTTYSNEFREKCLSLCRSMSARRARVGLAPNSSRLTTIIRGSRSRGHWFEFEVLCPYLLGIFRAKWSTMRISLDLAVQPSQTRDSRGYWWNKRVGHVNVVEKKEDTPPPLQNGTSLINPN